MLIMGQYMSYSDLVKKNKLLEKELEKQRDFEVLPRRCLKYPTR